LCKFLTHSLSARVVTIVIFYLRLLIKCLFALTSYYVTQIRYMQPSFNMALAMRCLNLLFFVPMCIYMFSFCYLFLSGIKFGRFTFTKRNYLAFEMCPLIACWSIHSLPQILLGTLFTRSLGQFLPRKSARNTPNLLQ